MSTWALLGLVVVVVLVAVGIAGFLRWGRGREDDVASSEGDRPRTVADLVDRRARGLDDGPRRPAPDPSAPPVPPGSPEPPVDDAPEPMVDEESPADREVAGSDAAVDDDPEDAVSATTPVAAVRPQEERPRPPAAEDAAPDVGPSSSAPDITEAVGAADPTDELPAVPRVTPDVSAGPVGPPWSRGFKDGKPLEPVEPAPARRTPAPTPFVRRRPVADPAARTVDEATAATGSGPDSSAPDISTPTSGTAVVGDASTTASEAPADASTGVTGDVASVGDTAPAGEEADESVDEAPPAATTQSRAPFDPDLVRRVTALPSERTSVRAPADPDTEREFREARDRISTPHTWAGRVPEQAGAPETAGDTPPVSRIPSIGLAATGARAAREPGDNPEPPPRPAPRVLRSARPGSGPRHLAPSLRGTSATDSGPDEDTASAEDTVVSGTAGDAGSPAGSGGTVTTDRTVGAVDAVDVRGPAGDTDASVPDTGERAAPTGDAAGAGTTDAAATDDVATGNAATGDDATGDAADGNVTPGITTGTDAADADAGGTNVVEGGADTDAPTADAPAGTDVTGTDATGTDVTGTDPAGADVTGSDATRTDATRTDEARTDETRTDEARTDATEGATRTVVPLAAAAVVAPVAAAATAASDTTVPDLPRQAPQEQAPQEQAPQEQAPQEQAPDEQAPREQGLQEQDPQAEAPTPDPTTPERSTTAPEAEETPVHAGPTTATRPDRAEDVSLSVLRTGPVPSAVVPDTAPQDVEVRVVDATDAPLPGAEVALRDRSGGPIGSATTDADGTAHVTAPGAGAFVVVARADGYLPGVATCTVGDDDAGTTLRLAAAAAVHGSAPAGTGVVLSQDGEPVASTTAAADGTYRLADLDPGRYLLAAGDGPGAEVDLVPGGDERRDLAGS
ncbi:carboxypeptidase-like regulatory domain-containing protein [Pseudonocardia sp. ICBG162]|uniref:carboxypeptidase-like regulatory domain-containing protein n=1 Tax=Pseudonocardia sp. ICBG162 TaxID=2846761 RepID=UPI001CF613DB|nr:carboxypeptidase-like regulatory domain-containing protein [Pseudonocardia sp. ICBG162]